MMEDPLVAVQQRLRAAGVAYRLIEHEPVRTMADVTAIFGQDELTRMVKSIAVQSPMSGLQPYVLCGLPGESRLDMAALAQVLQVSRGALGMIPVDTMPSIVGAPIGAAGLICPVPAARTILDERLQRHRYVLCGAGSVCHTLEFDLDTVAAEFGFEFAEIAKQ
jgi:prolyl-tRNA editing enzyme YbaK/EbsC (Cys-tRNA(Pro) deacylase)